MFDRIFIFCLLFKVLSLGRCTLKPNKPDRLADEPGSSHYRFVSMSGVLRPADPNGSQKFSTISAEGTDIFAKNIYGYAGYAFRLRPINREM